LCTLDLVEGFQLSHAVATLHSLEVFDALRKPATADELSARLGLDSVLLRGMLEYVSSRTDLLRRSGERFVATPGYSNESRFLLELYIGAYGRNAKDLSKLLRNPSAARSTVNRARHARAFDAIDGSMPGLLPEIIRMLGFNHVLDLGCGNGALLLELARQDSNFVGRGIDINPAMCRAARARIRAARVGKRLRVSAGDCCNLRGALPTKELNAVRSLTICNVANEFFTDGHSRAIKWLRGIGKLLPDRPILIADYYGRLGSNKGKPSRATLLHDYVQVISGQGVPPTCAKEWRSIYSRAGCTLVHMIEDKVTTRFIHILRS
jgi:SAM-dependent methyltransferase